MKTAKRLIIAFVLAMALCVGTLSFAACDGQIESPKDYGEAGVYYCDAASGDEYLFTLGKSVFTMLADGESVSGVYTYDGEVLTLTFADDILVETGKPAVAENVEFDMGKTLSFQYKGQQYSFLKKDTYTVKFDMGGAEAMGDAKVVNGRKLAKPADPAKEGSSFIGWYADGEYSVAYDFENAVTADMTLYARFEEVALNEYTVKLESGLGNVSFEPIETIGGKLFGLPELAAKDGAKFLGWWMSDFENAEQLTAQYTDQVIKENKTLYAVWENDGVAVSVDANGITWTSKGVGSSYTVAIYKEGQAQAIISRDVGTNAFAYDFNNQLLSGKYRVEVTYKNATTKAYYANKTLARVSLADFTDSGLFVFQPVENAERYTITVACGEERHNHTNYNLGNKTFFSFANCRMTEKGISFVVTAYADGYASSVSETFLFNKALGAVSGLAYDETTGNVTWNKVDGALYYKAAVTSGENTYTFTVLGDTALSLKEYTGALTVSVLPVAENYNLPAPATLEVTKTVLATPANVRIGGNAIAWDAVEGASSYTVYINDKSYDTEETTLEMPAEVAASGAPATVAVKAVSADGESDSLLSDAANATFYSMSGVYYANGMLYWTQVAVAQSYTVSLNGETTFEADADKNCVAITFNRDGVNTLMLTYKDVNGIESLPYNITVNVHKIEFDVMGGEKDAVRTLYKVAGDAIELPAPTYDGYAFAGWYNLPGGPKSNGARYDYEVFMGNANLKLYAAWTSNPYTVTLDTGAHGELEDGVSETTTVYFQESYVLPVPVSTNVVKVFTGWYTEPNSQGFMYTGREGSSISNWVDKRDRTLYAGWADIFTFTEIDNGSAYQVSKAAAISYVNEATVPAVYNDKPVTTIGGFASTSTLYVINLPDTLKLVEENAFDSCSNLTEVNIYEYTGDPEREKVKASIRKILEENAEKATQEQINKYNEAYNDWVALVKFSSIDGVLFDNNPAAEYGSMTIAFYPRGKAGAYSIPEGVTGLVQNTFKSCTKLTEVTIPASMRVIANSAFASCSGLVKVTFIDSQEAANNDLSLKSAIFSSCTKLTEITLPSRITELNLDMFTGCSTLENIYIVGDKSGYTSKDGTICSKDGKTLLYCPKGKSGTFRIPAGVIKIGGVTVANANTPKRDGAFLSCTKLTEVIIPAYVTVIGKEAFKSCSGITKLTFEGDANSQPLTIREGAFYYCSGLTEVTLPENLKLLEIYAFGGTSKLVRVNVLTTYAPEIQEILDAEGNPTGKTEQVSGLVTGSFGTTGINPTYYVTDLYIGPNVPAFGINGVFGSTKLASVSVDPANENYSTRDGVLYDKDVTEIIYYPLGREGAYIIPTTVTKIGDRVFANQAYMTSITIHKGIESIGDFAFLSCTKLTEVIFEEGGDKPLTIGDSAFYSCSGLLAINLPSRLVEIGDSAFRSCSKITSIVVPEGVTTIGANAFYSCSQLQSISFPSTLSKMGLYEEVEGKDGKKSIELTNIQDVFYSCTALTTLTVAANNPYYVVIDGVLYAKKGGEPTELYFAPRANSCEKVTIPTTVTKIWNQAFYYNKTIKEIEFAGAVDEKFTIGDQVFYYVGSLEKINLPEGLKVVPRQMFYYCSALTSITIPSTVTSMQPQAFYYCSNITEIEFADGGKDDLIIEDALPTTGTTQSASYSVFYGCNKLTKIEFPERTTKIGGYAFYNCTALAEVNIPANIKELGQYAFYGCKNLTKVDIPATVGFEKIKTYAFYNTGLTTFTVPEGIKELENYALSTNASLVSVTLPASLEKIGTYVFSGCSKLTSVKFADNAKLTEIGNYAFQNCVALTSIEIPASIKTIGTYVFSGDKELATVTFSNENTALTEIGNYAFQNCGLTTFTIPKNVTYDNDGKKTIKIIKLGENMFNGCSKLESVYMSESVANIDNVFTNCSNLNLIQVHGDNENFKGHATLPMIMNIDETAIRYVYGLLPAGEFAIPEGIEEVADKAFQNQTQFTAVTLPATLKRINQYAFSTCTNLRTVTFAPGSIITEIRAYAFQNCESLQYIELPDSIIKLGYKWTVNASTGKVTEAVDSGCIFDGCKSLTRVKLPANLTHIGGAYIFRNCSSLTDITLPATLEIPGNYMFQGCTSLRSITLPAKLSCVTYGTYMFQNCSSLSSVIIESGFKQIPNYMFQNCTSLTSIVLPDSVEKIGNYSFDGCTSLSSIKLPTNSKLTTLGTYTFRGCTSLTTIKLPDSLTIIDNSTFQNCTSLTSITIPEKVTRIGSYAFRNTGLTEVTIPAKVKELGYSTGYAFAECANLTKVTFAKDYVLTHIYAYAFTGCSSLSEIKTEGTDLCIPDTVTYIGNYAFGAYGTEGASGYMPATAIKKMNIPYINATSVTATIGQYMFRGCKELESVTMDDQIVALQNYMFQDCTSLKTLKLPSSLQYLGKYTFMGSGLTEIEIPASVVNMSCNASLTPTTVLNFGTTATATTYDAAVFKDCQELTKVAFKGQVTVISDRMFQNCPKLANLTYVDANGATREGIPSSIQYIGSYAFADNTSLKVMTLPVSLKRTGIRVFENSGLTKVVVPLGITELSSRSSSTVTTHTDSYLFNNCENLLSVEFETREDGSSDVTWLGGYIFYDCVNLKSINLPEGLTYIGNQTFRFCETLPNITLPESLEIIEMNAFMDCYSFTTMHIPKNVKAIYNNAFAALDNLVGFTVDPDNNYFYTGQYGELMRKEDGSLVCVPLTLEGEFRLAEGATIGSWAFNAHRKIHTVILPEGITEIPANAFMGMYGLKEITVPEGVTTIGTAAFGRCEGMTKINLPSTLKTIGERAFEKCYVLTEITLPENVEQICQYAFQASGLESITIPESVKYLGGALTTTTWETSSTLNGYVFYRCENLKEITLNEGLEYIGAYTFSGCLSLETLVVPASVKVVASYAFANNTSGTSPAAGTALAAGVKEVTFLGEDISFGTYVFRGAEQLTTVNFNEKLKNFQGTHIISSTTKLPNNTTGGNYMFQNCTGMVEAQLPKNLEIMPTYMFQGSGIVSAYIPATVATVSNYAFQNCYNLKNVVIEEGVTEIGTYVFSYSAALTEEQHSSLEYISFPSSVTTIGMYAFRFSNALKEVVLPDRLEKIGTYLFSECTSLEKVELPNTLTEITSYAFSGCASLKEMVIPASVNLINTNAFKGCTGIKSIVIPSSVIQVKNNVFDGWTAEQTIYSENSEYFALANWTVTSATSHWYANCEANVVWEYKK